MHYSCLMHLENQTKDDAISEENTAQTGDAASAHGKARADLIALFRLLLKQPPKDHDFRNCPICKRYRITEI
jgi:hypothetical protein